MPRSPLLLVSGLLVAGALAGASSCTRESSPDATPLARAAPADEAAGAYATPLRSDSELRTAMADVCAAGLGDARPLLLEFSAEWCGDCLAVHEMKKRPPLRSELTHWSRVSVNVGRFDRHDELLRSFGVTAIAKWVALRPDDCSAPPTRWPRLAARTLEPASGTSVRVDELAAWLEDARLGRR